MKHVSTLAALTAMTLTLGSASANAATLSANFTGSTSSTLAYDGTATSAANLNSGTVGGTWSSVSTTSSADNATIRVLNDGSLSANHLHIGIRSGDPGNDATHVSTATLDLDSAADLDGTTLSFDAQIVGFGGQPGTMFVDLYDGTTHVLRIGLGNSAGEGRGTVSHFSAIGVDIYQTNRTQLTAAENAVWEGIDAEETVTLNLGATNFTVATTDTDLALSGALAYINSATSFDSVVFSATGAKSDWGVDNIAVVPEPSSLALLGLGGLLIARRRRG